MTDLTAMRAAMDEAYPTPDSPHTSILERAKADRIAFQKGFQAAWNARPAAQVSEAVAWLHTMDNTEGIKGNEPRLALTFSKQKPFGIPGRDYSKTFPVTSVPLYTYPATEQADVPTWQERVRKQLPELDFKWLQPAYQIEEMQAEIADLRAALARKGQP
jgi:hypothetical protein